MRIVIAEDDVWVSREIHRLAKDLGHEVVGEAASGREAVEVVCNLKPDVVLMDIEMPEMNGLDAVKEIQEKCPTPVVMLTAYESEDLLERAGNVGAGAYLIKPTHASEIERALIIAVARHGDLMRLRQALKSERLINREIYHRVKNNLTLISSLLRLQSKASNDPRVSDALLDSESRVRTIAVIHEMLQTSKDHNNVNLGTYLEKVARKLYESYTTSAGDLSLEVEAEDIMVSSDKAVNFGLILSELMTNAAKYAFPDASAGQLRLSLSSTGTQRAALVVSDNGVGLPEDIDLKTQDTFGVQLVKDLVQQIGGNMQVVCQDGTEFRIEFDT